MARGCQFASLALDAETPEQLPGLSQSTTLAHNLVLRAMMILASAEGFSIT